MMTDKSLISSYDSETLSGRLSRWWKHNVTEYFSPSETPLVVKATHSHDTSSQRPMVWANPHDTSSQTAAARPMIWDPRKLFADFIKRFAEPETPLYFDVLKTPEFMQYLAWRSQINLENEFAERIFCQDLIWQVIQFGAKVIKKKNLLKVFPQYENSVDESFFQEIKSLILKFQDEASSYFKNHTDKETGTLFVTLPNKMVREVIGKINASFDNYEKELSVEEIDENEVEGKTFYQVAKESLQAGYHVLRKHPWKVIGAIASTAAIMYAGKRADSTNFNPLTMPQFPQWATPSWQMTNAVTMLGLSYVSGGAALPYAMAGLALSMIREVKADLRTGLVAYYPFTNGTLSDMSGHGNDGTNYGAQPTSDRFGNPNSAYYFNGSTRIDVQRVVDFYFPNDEASITFWFTLDDLERSYNGLIGREDFQWVALQYNEGVTHQLRYWIGNCGAGWSTTPTGTIIPKTDWVQGQWYFVAWIKSQNYVKVYINNQTLLTVSWTGTVCNPTSPLHIGRSQISSRTHLGKIDGLHIYKRSLNSTEIQELYSLGDVLLNITIPDPSQNLVAYYPFTNGTLYDMSGHGNDGTNYGAQLTTDRFGNPNRAYYFNGSTRIDVQRVDDFTFSPNNEASIAFWFTLDDLERNYNGMVGRENYQWVLLQYNEGVTHQFRYWIDSDCSPGWSTTPTGTIVPKTDWVQGQWYFVAWIKTQNYVEVYIDGQLLLTVPWTGSVCNPSSPLHIGRGQLSDRSHLGKIGAMRIYDRPLIYSEIQALYEWQETSSSSSTSFTSTSSSSSSSSTSSSTTMPTRSSSFTLTSSFSFFGSSKTVSTSQDHLSSENASGSGVRIWMLLLPIGGGLLLTMILVGLVYGRKHYRKNEAKQDQFEMETVPSAFPNGDDKKVTADSSQYRKAVEDGKRLNGTEYANKPSRPNSGVVGSEYANRPEGSDNGLPPDYANAPKHPPGDAETQASQYGKLFNEEDSGLPEGEYVACLPKGKLTSSSGALSSSDSGASRPSGSPTLTGLST